MISTDAFDVFVGHPATPAQVRRTLEYCLHSAPFDCDPDNTGWAELGRHSALHADHHDLADDTLCDRALPLKLASDYPVRIRIHPLRLLADTFEQEAVARRVFAVIRANAWPALLTHRLADVLELVRP